MRPIDAMLTSLAATPEGRLALAERCHLVTIERRARSLLSGTDGLGLAVALDRLREDLAAYEGWIDREGNVL